MGRPRLRLALVERPARRVVRRPLEAARVAEAVGPRVGTLGREDGVLGCHSSPLRGPGTPRDRYPSTPRDITDSRGRGGRTVQTGVGVFTK